MVYDALTSMCLPPRSSQYMLDSIISSRSKSLGKHSFLGFCKMYLLTRKEIITDTCMLKFEPDVNIPFTPFINAINWMEETSQ